MKIVRETIVRYEDTFLVQVRKSFVSLFFTYIDKIFQEEKNNKYVITNLFFLYIEKEIISNMEARNLYFTRSMVVLIVNRTWDTTVYDFSYEFAFYFTKRKPTVNRAPPSLSSTVFFSHLDFFFVARAWFLSTPPPPLPPSPPHNTTRAFA